MRRIKRIWLHVAAATTLLGVISGCRATPAIDSPRSAHSLLEGRTQLITVVTEGWDSFRATLRRYEKSEGEWRELGAPVEAVIGRAGYGWGRGLHGDGPPLDHAGPVKAEGDGRSPAGLYGIGHAYGYDATWPEVSLTYAQATDALRCVDDPKSVHYNEIVSTNDVEVDWDSAEHMRREDDLYVLAIVVEHNTYAPRPGGGSCIFLHLWSGPDAGMSGCTAMSMEALRELAAWLRPGAAAVVALPKTEYDALRSFWGLPTRK